MNFHLPKIQLHFFWEKTSAILLFSLLPFLAIGGAFSLNNGGSNIITMILFTLISLLFIVLIWRKGLNSLYPYAIFTIGLAVLFSTSLRGWYITGHDIRHEFNVFQTTNNNSFWLMRTPSGDPYNACLSITIFPAILAKITAIPSMYIYKLVFQIIFAFGLIPIYLFIKKMSNERTAFIGAFLFISFPTFLNDLTFLNRQEIAFVFFSLLMLTTFLDISRKPKTILTIILILGLIFSHYSSTYVMIGILLLSWVIYHIAKHLQNIKEFFVFPTLSLPMILFAFLLTFFWHSEINGSTNGLLQTITYTINDFKQHTSSHATFVKYGLLSSSVQSSKQELKNYVSGKNNQAQYIPPQQMRLTDLGKSISRVVNIQSLNIMMHT